MGNEFDPVSEESDPEVAEAEVQERDPGWYDDPLIEGQQRNWDGSQWTNEVREAPANKSPQSEPSTVSTDLSPTSAGTLPPAGWYPDNHDPTKQRWWNGSNWTNQVHDQTPAYCKYCSQKLEPGQSYCQSCGKAVSTTPPTNPAGRTVAARSSEPKSAGLAMFLNFLWPGAGHLYAGVKTDFGTIFAVITGGLFLLTLFTVGFGLLLAIPAWLVMAPWSMIDVNNLLKDQ